MIDSDTNQLACEVVDECRQRGIPESALLATTIMILVDAYRAGVHRFRYVDFGDFIKTVRKEIQ